MPERRSRRIRVDGVPYRWVGRDLVPAGGRIVVQAAAGSGAVLVLRWGADWAVAHVPPARVALLIGRARAAGWDPHRPGAAFVVEVTPWPADGDSC